MIKIIAALGENRVIGNKGKIPWYFPEDLERFREIITGKKIVMGRKTYESLKQIYPNNFGHPKAQENIVLSKTLKISGEKIYSNIKEILKDYKEKELIIIGGGEIYKEFLPFADELDLTRVIGNFEGDTFFPEFENIFTNISQEQLNDKRVIYEKWIRK